MDADSYQPLIRSLQTELNHTVQTKALDLQRFFERTEQSFQAMGFREPHSSGVENILVLSLDVMGDFILRSGFLRELRANYPSARITLVVSDYIFPLAELCPYVNEVLHFDTRIPETNKLAIILMNIMNFAMRNLWRRHFTKCFCPQGGGFKDITIFMAYLSGASERIGFEYPKHLTDVFFNRVPAASKHLIHVVDQTFHMLTELGLSIRDKSLELWYDAEDIQTVRRLLENVPNEKKLIAVGLGAGNLNRKYPVELYAQALRSIIQDHEECLLIGGPNEREDSARLQSMLPSERVLNLTGELTLRQTAAAISMSDMYIGNDTGMMHMATAAQIPVITLYREAKDKSDAFVDAELPSEYYMFAPYRTLSIALRPERAVGECHNSSVYGGCLYNAPHCIASIPPAAIVDAYNKLTYILSNNPKQKRKRGF